MTQVERHGDEEDSKSVEPAVLRIQGVVEKRNIKVADDGTTSETDGAHIVTAVVPETAVPGCAVAIDTTEGSELTVVLPPQAQVGDSIVLTKEGTQWKCGLKRNLKTSEEPTVINLLIPPLCTPGVTLMGVTTGSNRKIQVRVPVGSIPGDKMVLTRETNSSGASHWEGILCSEGFTGPKPRAWSAESEPLCEGARLMATPDIEPLDAEVACQQLLQRIVAGGGFVSSKMRRGSVPPLNVPGLLAVEPIEEGELLCSIPQEMHINPGTVQRIAPDLWKAVAQSTLPEGRQGEAAQASFLARLLQEASDRAKSRSTKARVGETAPWIASLDPAVRAVYEAYADQLLREDFLWHPYRRAAVEPQVFSTSFGDSPEADTIFDITGDVSAVYSLLSSQCAECMCTLDVTTFFRARLCILSRVFFTTETSTLVPFADLFNHDVEIKNRKPGVVWGYDAEKRAMVVTASRAHEPGEELLDSYGPRSNVLLYRTYGFTSPPHLEPHWSFNIRADAVRQIYDVFLPPTKRDLVILLDSRQLDDTLVVALNTVTKHGEDAKGFLLLLCGRMKALYDANDRLKPAREALGRARAKDPASPAWWSELEDDASGLRDEDVLRILMCEYLCLVAHMDALAYLDGQWYGSHLLTGTGSLALSLQQAFAVLKEHGQFSSRMIELGSEKSA